jgi:hypothetical protein
MKIKTLICIAMFWIGESGFSSGSDLRVIKDDVPSHVELHGNDTLDIETVDASEFVRLSAFPKLVPFPFMVACSKLVVSPDRRWAVLHLIRNRDSVAHSYARDYFALLVCHKDGKSDKWTVFYRMKEEDLSLQHGGQAFVSEVYSVSNSGLVALEIGRLSVPQGPSRVDVYNLETWDMNSDTLRQGSTAEKETIPQRPAKP